MCEYNPGEGGEWWRATCLLPNFLQKHLYPLVVFTALFIKYTLSCELPARPETSQSHSMAGLLFPSSLVSLTQGSHLFLFPFVLCKYYTSLQYKLVEEQQHCCIWYVLFLSAMNLGAVIQTNWTLGFKRAWTQYRSPSMSTSLSLSSYDIPSLECFGGQPKEETLSGVAPMTEFISGISNLPVSPMNLFTSTPLPAFK